MYAVVACSACKRLRVVDLHTKQSACPYCSHEDVHKDLQPFYRGRTQDHARQALGKLTGFTGDGMARKHADPNTDPFSSLVYKYEHTAGLDSKMAVLAEGLTKIYGTFTLVEVEAVDPKNGPKMLKGMLAECYIAEVAYGRYKG
ncbi:MAG: hypothetical protein WCS40_03680 [Methanomethylophilus sp.]